MQCTAGVVSGDCPGKILVLVSPLDICKAGEATVPVLIRPWLDVGTGIIPGCEHGVLPGELLPQVATTST